MADENQKNTAPEAATDQPASDQKEEMPMKLDPVSESEKPKPSDEAEIAQFVSFKEETNVAGELPDAHRKALDDLKQLIKDAINKHEFKAPPPPPPVNEQAKKPAARPLKEVEEDKATPPPPSADEAKDPAEPVPAAEVDETAETVTVAVATTDDDGTKTVEAIKETVVATSAKTPPCSPEEVSIWGIPLLRDDRSDVVLLKFLRARDFKVKDAFAMIQKTVQWREEFGIEAVLDQVPGDGGDLEKVVFMHGSDKEGHPVCYNVYGEFQNKELYQSSFSDEEKRLKFLRWRIQFLEKSIRKLDFTPDGVSTILQVTDLRNSPGPGKWGLRQATSQALQLLQDNYPEFVAKQVFINVPWWYAAFNAMISPFLTLRTKSKFVFARPSKSAETLFGYVAPEQVPIQYGGLSKVGGEDQEFTTADPATEISIKPTSKHTVEIPFSEMGVLVWEARVLGWNVRYGAEFVPAAEDGYTVILEKTRKVTAAEEIPVVSGRYKIGEPGSVAIVIDNQSSKKKKLLFRSKIKPSSD